MGVTLIRDSAGFIVQRTLASIVNLACDIAQQGIASVEHIDLAVRLGLGYPLGPLEWATDWAPGACCASSNACMRSAATRAIAPVPGCAGAPNWAFPCASRTARWPPDPFAEKHTMLDAYIYAGLRTPFGRHAGALSTVRPDDLAGLLLARLAETSGFAVDDLEDVILGCTNQAGEDSRNLARNALLAAGLPARLPGQTVNRLCASGLSAVIDAARAISCGEGRLYLAAPKACPGRRSSWPRRRAPSAARWRSSTAPSARASPTPGWSSAMATTACRRPATTWPAPSASPARRRPFRRFFPGALPGCAGGGLFLGEILPVEVRAGRKGETRLVERDEHPRPQADLAALARLPALFAGG